MTAHDGIAIEATRRWIAETVIGLNLCPFARRPFDGGRVRYAVTDAADEAELLVALKAELTALARAPRAEIETALVIHPHALADFLDYNDFLATADALVRRMRLRGVIQIASFHPGYRFADAEPDAAENYSNRSPYPMLHLLREESVTEVTGDAEAMAEIPRRNVDVLRRIGRAEMAARLKAVALPRPPGDARANAIRPSAAAEPGATRLG